MNDWLFRLRLQKFVKRIQFCLNKVKIYIGWNNGEVNYWIVKLQEEIKKILNNKKS